MFKVRTHRKSSSLSESFQHSKDEEIVSKNMAMKSSMAQTKLPWHVEAQNTKKSDLQHSWTLFRKAFNFVHLKCTSKVI